MNARTNELMNDRTFLCAVLPIRPCLLRASQLWKQTTSATQQLRTLEPKKENRSHDQMLAWHTLRCSLTTHSKHR